MRRACRAPRRSAPLAGPPAGEELSPRVSSTRLAWAHGRQHVEADSAAARVQRAERSLSRTARVAHRPAPTRPRSAAPHDGARQGWSGPRCARACNRSRRSARAARRRWARAARAPHSPPARPPTRSSSASTPTPEITTTPSPRTGGGGVDPAGVLRPVSGGAGPVAVVVVAASALASVKPRGHIAGSDRRRAPARLSEALLEEAL